MKNQLTALVDLQAAGQRVGIYSVCSANEYVLRAALRYGRENRIPVLIEATANQVNQFGGYTGMTPADFAAWLRRLAEQEGIAWENVILGGDHLGPLVWRGEDPDSAMAKAERLVADCVAAGFRKIHIDTSMPLGDDLASGRFGHELIARRSARLAVVCEKAFAESGLADRPVYVVGSEVPIPGGALDEEMTVTDPAQFERELQLFWDSWTAAGADPSRIVGFVVQPGVEFTNTTVHAYSRRRAAELCRVKGKYPRVVFEGHSTDYQPTQCLRQMVEDGVAILKVGPALTNAAREGLFSLERIAGEMPGVTAVPFRQTLLEAMERDDGYWRAYYAGSAEEVAFQMCYGMSDRCRYYLSVPEVAGAVKALLGCFGGRPIPMQLLSQYMPVQFARVRDGLLTAEPEALLMDYIAGMYRQYASACGDMGALGFT